MINPFKKILSLFRTKSFWTSSFGSVFFTDEPSRPTSKDYFDSYEVCFLVHSCVRKICEKVASTELKLYKVKNKEVDEIENHEVLDLLAKPNPFMTRFDLLDVIQMYLELSGNAYILQVRGENSRKTKELWMLRPDWVKVLPGNAERPIRGYEYRIYGGEVQTFEPEDIIHIKQPNPKSSYYGLSTVQPALEIIRNLVYATRWNMNFFYRNARPDFILTTKAKMSKEEKAEFAKQWEQKFGGLEKAHRFGIFSGEEADIKEITKSARDMEFTKLTDAMIQQILAAFGVPKPIVGFTTDLNRATSESAIYSFLSETIEPKVKRIVDKLNEFLIIEYGEDLYLDYIDPTPENREYLLKEYDNALKNNWMVINEVRDLEGLPPLEGGWDFYLPLALMPAGGVPEGERVKHIRIKGINSETYYQNKKAKEQKKLLKKVMEGKRKLKAKEKFKSEVKELLLKEMKKYIEKVKNLTKEQKNQYWQEYDKALTFDQNLFKALAKKLFQSQKKRLLKALKEQFGKKGKFDLLNWKTEQKLFFILSFPVFEDIVGRSGKKAARLIGTDFAMSKPVMDFIEDKSLVFAKQVNETTKEKVKEALEEGVKEGEGVQDLTKRLEEVFKDRERWESERIARTEVIEASNGAAQKAYEQSGVVEKKEWLAEPDACEFCIPLGGKVVDLKDNFGEVDFPPLHPNCRCTILPVIEEAKAIPKIETKKEPEKPAYDIEKDVDNKLVNVEKKLQELVEAKIKASSEELKNKIDEVLN